MRELKFRAWHKDLRIMLYKDFFDHNWYTTPRNDDSGCHTYCSMQYSDKQHMELMQFTGLKDKNGKEIYEGDILMHEDFIGRKQKVLGVMTWEKNTACFTKFYPLFKFEICGNIYENPELLQEAK